MSIKVYWWFIPLTGSSGDISQQKLHRPTKGKRTGKNLRQRSQRASQVEMKRSKNGEKPQMEKVSFESRAKEAIGV